MHSATGVLADRGGPRPAVGALRDLPHALHGGARPQRRGRRRAPRTDAVPRVAPQRLSRRAQLPVLSHAAGRRPHADRLRARRAARGVGRHAFLGGNVFMLRMLNRYRGELGVDALPVELEAAARATPRIRTADRHGLASRSTGARRPAACSTRRGGPQPDRSQAADRLPVAPRLAAPRPCATRADARVFESGAVDARLARSSATTTTPTAAVRTASRRASARADQVQIYESIMADAGGRGDDRPAAAARGIVKDNRLLPRGFDKATAAAPISPSTARPGRSRFRRRAIGSATVSTSGAPPARCRHRGAALSADRVQLGAEPRTVRRGRAPAFRLLLRRHVVAVLDRGLDGKPAGAVGRKAARKRRPRRRSVRSWTTRADPCGPCCPWLGTGSALAPTRQGRAEPPQQWFCGRLDGGGRYRQTTDGIGAPRRPCRFGSGPV